MTKRELVDRLSRRSVNSKKDVHRVLALLLDAIQVALKEGGEVRLIPFGTFTTRQRKARRARNPRTGERILTREMRVAYFRPGKLLRQALKN